MSGCAPRSSSPSLSCPALGSRASMTTAGANHAPPVVMDCRDKPGNDTSESWNA
jgi:hypothetical protein